MEFNKWYDYWFENNGFCPFCGKYMNMSIGCYNRICPMTVKAEKEDRWIFVKVRLLEQLKKKEKERNERLFGGVGRKEQNLDTSSKKHYLKDDNQGISE